MAGKGIVYLVGVGPCDPDLLTVKGKTCVEKADSILYDTLVDEQLLEWARPDAERIRVAPSGDRTISPKEVSTLLIAKAREGKTVVRLKSGDPFTVDREADEINELAASGIPFEVVPGIIPGHAAAVYAGIPLRYGAYGSSVAFIGESEDPANPQLTGDPMANGLSTLVFHVKQESLPSIVENLMRHGRDPQTPIAVISQGASPSQRTVTGSLATIIDRVAPETMRPPVIAIVGDLVTLRERLNWFEKKPLFGKKIIVTRARQQAASLSNRLKAYGASVVEFPTIEIAPPESVAPLEKAIENLQNYDWIIFTSVNGVAFFLDRLRISQRDLRDLKGLKVCAIGPATAAAIETLHVNVDIVPDEYRAESIIECLARALGDIKKIRNLNILLPRAKLARDVLPNELRRLGARIDVVEAYRTVLPTTDRGAIEARLQRREIDLVTFTSSSTVSHFAALFSTKDLSKILEGVDIACIGPITAETASRFNLTTQIMPEAYTIPALVEAIVNHYRRAD